MTPTQRRYLAELTYHPQPLPRMAHRPEPPSPLLTALGGLACAVLGLLIVAGLLLLPVPG
jgi:hypothetical protein